MKNVVLIILILSYCFVHAQIPVNQGEGSVNIGFYVYRDIDTTNIIIKETNLFTSYYYRMKGHLILRSEHKSDSSVLATSNKILDKKTTKIITSLNAKVHVPTYVINWKTKMIYTFYDKNNQINVSEGLLKNDQQDIFYKKMADSPEVKTIIDTLDQHMVYICGILCYEAKYLSNFGWRKFAYTKRKIRFFSPLNSLIKGFSYPVFSIDAENTDDKENKSRITAISRFQIRNFSEADQDASIFKLPQQELIKRNVSFKDMYF